MEKLAEHVRGDELFIFLPEQTLQHVISDDQTSTYLFLCGCVAVREATSSTCGVQWCSRHEDRFKRR